MKIFRPSRQAINRTYANDFLECLSVDAVFFSLKTIYEHLQRKHWKWQDIIHDHHHHHHRTHFIFLVDPILFINLCFFFSFFCVWFFCWIFLFITFVVSCVCRYCCCEGFLCRMTSKTKRLSTEILQVNSWNTHCVSNIIYHVACFCALDVYNCRFTCEYTIFLFLLLLLEDTMCKSITFVFHLKTAKKKHRY